MKHDQKHGRAAEKDGESVEGRVGDHVGSWVGGFVSMSMSVKVSKMKSTKKWSPCRKQWQWA